MTSIILEGPDGAGKTTLARQLEQLLGDTTTLAKGPPRSTDWVEEYLRPLIHAPPNLVCDRWHWGERVYPQVLGRKSILSPAAFRWLELWRASRGILVILLLPNIDLLRQRLDDRGDELINADQLTELVRGYRNVVFSGTTERYVSGSPVPDPHPILTIAHWLARDAGGLAPWPSYVGPPQPEVLLVGDRPGPRHLPPDCPAFMPTPTSSGRYLLNCLPGGNWERHGLVNASQPGLHPLWKKLGKPRVVALGRQAQYELGRQSIDCGAVPHPQYMRRFHHRALTHYERALNNAAHSQADLIKETTT